MKNRRVEAAAVDANDKHLALTGAFPFRIVALRRVSYGSKTAEFSLETPIGVVEADLFTPEGREAFVQARSVRCKYSGDWKRTVALDRAFATRVLDALRAQVSTAKEKRDEHKPQSVVPSGTLLESEQRFDAASAALDDGDGAP